MSTDPGRNRPRHLGTVLLGLLAVLLWGTAAGAASGGTLDASNLLKPALSSGNLKCIGATTYNEYRQIFEKDHALSRRFQKVAVN